MKIDYSVVKKYAELAKDLLGSGLTLVPEGKLQNSLKLVEAVLAKEVLLKSATILVNAALAVGDEVEVDKAVAELAAA